MSLLADILKEIPLSAVLREKVANLEAENAALKTENAILKDDLRQAKVENQQLDSLLQGLTRDPGLLDESEAQILLAMAT